MDKVFVKDLKTSENIRSTYLVIGKNVGTDKKGNSFLALTLSDKTGQVDARYFGDVDGVVDDFTLDDFVLVKGFVQKYQNRPQIIIHSLEPIQHSEVNIADYLPVSKFDRNEMFQELMGILEGIENKFVRELVLNTLNDPEIQPLFKDCPAAKSVHHAYIGGLLEHTLSICKVMIPLSKHYTMLDLDLLLFGAVYHDIAKIWELSFETKIGYTDSGRLVGHIPMGSELVEKKSSEIANFPVELKNVCKHIVLSHHGKLEFGSPKRPKCLEALVVGIIDELDSRVNSIPGILMQHSPEEGQWTPYSQMYDRYFYLGTLKK